jgi:hypothetical protein
MIASLAKSSGQNHKDHRAPSHALKPVTAKKRKSQAWIRKLMDSLTVAVAQRPGNALK